MFHSLGASPEVVDDTMKTTSSRINRTDAYMNSQILTAHTRPDRFESIGKPAVREGCGS